MSRALKLAEVAGAAGEIPVGAVIINKDGELIAQAANRKERNADPTAHAEILAIRQASQILQSWHLDDCTLYTTLEPCPMCAGALVQARMGEVVYGATDPKRGALGGCLDLANHPSAHHGMRVQGGVLAEEGRQLLENWFRQRRRQARLAGKREARFPAS